MIETAIIITVIVCGTTLIGYIARLMFLSKCKKSSCCGGVITIERSIESEEKNVSALRLPIGMTDR